MQTTGSAQIQNDEHPPKHVKSDAQIEEEAVSLYSHVKEIAALKYESELRREDSLIQQSSHMQTAFSFMTAAVFMALPVLVDNRDGIHIRFYFWAASTIVASLLVSLLFASLAQRRFKKQTFMNIIDIEKFVSDTYADTLDKSAQLKQWVQVVGDVQEDLDRTNRKRVQLIQWSMGFFFGSIGLIAFWFIYGLTLMY